MVYPRRAAAGTDGNIGTAEIGDATHATTGGLLKIGNGDVRGDLTWSSATLDFGTVAVQG